MLGDVKDYGEEQFGPCVQIIGASSTDGTVSYIQHVSKSR